VSVFQSRNVDHSRTSGEPRQSYQEYLRDLTLARARVYAVLAMTLFPVFSFLDFLTQSRFAWPFLYVRLAESFVCTLILMFTYTTFGKRHAWLLALFVAVTAAISIEGMVAALGPHSSPYYPGLFLVILATGLLLPWDLKRMAAFCTFILAVYVIPVAFEQGPIAWTVLVNNVYFLTGSSIITSAAAHFQSRNRLREFELRATLQETTERLREFDRLKTQFFANMSHELRTPLTLILSPLEELQRANTWPDQARQQLALMSRNGRRLLHLINNLLDLQKIEAGRLQLNRTAADLSRMILELSERFEPLAKRKRIEFSVLGAKEARVVYCDADRVDLMLQNLLSNAFKLTPDGGRIEIEVKSPDGGDRVGVEVRDTGIGIPKEHLDRIFDRFAQADGSVTRRYGGTGIGLALVREMADLHGGTASAESELGKGSCFRVTLPRGEGTLTAQPAEAAFREGISQQRLYFEDWDTRPMKDVIPNQDGGRQSTVLAVDDNPDVLRLLKSLLEPKYRVLTAENAREALSLAREAAPDLVISDIMMPEQSGFDLTRALREDRSTLGIPVLLLTAKADNEALFEGFASGAVDFIRKPFTPGELRARVDAQIRIHQLTRLLAQTSTRAAVGTLAAGVAHEVNNPLAVIQLLCEEFRDGADAKGILERIETMNARIARVTRVLMTLAGEEDGTARDEELDLAALAGEVALFFEERARTAHVALEFGPHNGPIPVRGSRRDLAIAITHLMENALRIASQSPRKWMRLETRMTNAVQGRGPAAEVSVLDSGPGVPKGLEERIFFPFFTTLEIGKSLGVGLSTARTIAESHGGTVRLDPRDGTTCFSLVIPQGLPQG